MAGSIGRWIAACCALLLAACNPVAELGDGDEAVAQFHRQLDAREFDRIWRSSHPEMRKAQSRADYEAFVTAVRDKLGKVERGERQGFNVNTSNGVTFVTINMHTTFERGEADEVFVFRRDGERLALLNYNINSRALIVN
jgi:hypothetical protein